MPISKNRISSPLEAGTSLFESQKLPLQVVEALDYVSDKLIKKRLHLTLIVARNTSYGISLNYESSASASPSSTSTYSPSNASLFSKANWPTRGGSLRSTLSPSPLSPIVDTLRPTSPTFPASATTDIQGISLLHVNSLSEKACRHLHVTVTKASKKFRLGCSGLIFPTTSPESGIGALPKDLVRHSLQQNDVVFSNEGLTLLSLDRLYTFKLALTAYSASTGNAVNNSLTAAVNELRLLVLSHNGRRISAAYVHRSYGDIVISNLALRTINTAYLSMYRSDAIALQPDPEPSDPRASLNGKQSSGLQNQTNTEFVAAGEDAKGIEVLRLSQWLGHRLGPNTPNGNDDVTPITRGEWGHLMEQREGGNLGGIETC